MYQNYFTNCKTSEEIKKEYRRLCFLHHPDLGGDEEIMKEINRQYAAASDNRTRQERPNWTEYQYREANEVAEIIRKAIEQIITLEGINIEVCGLWVWVSGNTYPIKDVLKKAGFKFASKKRMWYFAGVPAKNYNRQYSMPEIREMHGTKTVKLDENERVVYA